MTKIMIIEDDLDNRELLQECLELENYEVVAYENGQTALANLDKNNRPDILLMDLCFPVFSAEDFVKSFRDKTSTDVPIIVLSGKPDIKKVSERIAAYSYLQKPYDLFKLYSEILTALNSQSGAKAA